MSALNAIMNYGVMFRGQTNILSVARQVATGTTQIGRNLKSLQSELAGTANYLDKQRRSEALAIGSQMGRGATVAVGAALLRSVSSAAKFESQLNRVQIVAQELNMSNEALQRSFLGIASATGIASDALAKIAQIGGTTGFLGQLQKKYGNDAGAIRREFMDYVDTVAKFSVVSGQSPTVAGTEVADLIRQLNLVNEGPGYIKKFVSATQLIGKNSASNAKQVMEFVKALVPLRNVTKLSISDLLALAGTVRSFGGEVSKNLIKTNLPLVMKKAAEETAAFAQFFGMSQAQFIKLKDEKPLTFFIQLLEKLRGIKDSNQKFNETMKALNLNTQRLAPLLAGATGQIENLKDMLKMAEDAMNGVGDTLEKDFRKRLETFSQQWERAREIIGGFSVTVGASLLPSLTAVLTVLNNIGATMLMMSQNSVFSTIMLGAALKGASSAVGVGAGFLKDVVNTHMPAKPRLIPMTGGQLGPMQRVFDLPYFASFGQVIGAGLNAAIPLMAKFLAMAVAVGAAFKAIQFMFHQVFGPGMERLITNARDISKAFWQIRETGKISFADFVNLHDRGLEPIVKGLVDAADEFDMFIEGVKQGFRSMIGEGNDSPFKIFVNTLFEIFKMIGLVTSEISDGGDSMKAAGEKIGMIFGGIVRVLIEALKWVIRAGTLVLRMMANLEASEMLQTIVGWGRMLFGGLSGAVAGGTLMSGTVVGTVPGAIIGGIGGVLSGAYSHERKRAELRGADALARRNPVIVDPRDSGAGFGATAMGTGLDIGNYFRNKGREFFDAAAADPLKVGAGGKILTEKHIALNVDGNNLARTAVGVAENDARRRGEIPAMASWQE